MSEVSGDVVLPEGVELPSKAVLRVSVEDVSRADASAEVAAVTELRGLAGSGPFAFRLDVPEVDPAAHYSVRVHVDLDGSGQVASGDLVSTSSYPVLTRGHAGRVGVSVRRVP